MAIETIEHARDIRTLLDYTAKRLKPSSRLFVQSLLHQSRAYLMDDSNWMGRNFFRDISSFVHTTWSIMDGLSYQFQCDTKSIIWHPSA